MAKVSILMNCYNGEKYLKEAIDSVISQTYMDWELIFWDNQSTDTSAEIVKSYNDTRIKYIYAPDHTALGKARNLALKECSAKYITFLDTDDVWLPYKLETQLEAIDGKEFALCYSNAFWMDEHSLIFRTTTVHKNPNFKTLLKRYDINMHTVMLNIDKIDKNEIYFDQNLSYCPDFDLFLRLAYKHSNQIISIQTPLIKYRVHNDSLSKKLSMQQADEVLNIINNLESNLEKNEKINYKKEFAHAKTYNYSIKKANYFVNSNNFTEARKHFLNTAKLNIRYVLPFFVCFFPLKIAKSIFVFLHKNGIYSTH